MTITRAPEGERRKSIPEEFSPYVKAWFNKKFRNPSPPQEYAFPLIHKRKNLLISAPTGSVKTLSAFLSMINHLFELSDKGELKDEIYVVYISPLRALNNDIQRNLEEPLVGILEEAKKGGKEIPAVRSGVRTGDTPHKFRL